MTNTTISIPGRVDVTPMAGANNSTLRRDSAVSAADEHGTLNREVGSQIWQDRRMFNYNENILHLRHTFIADLLLTISNYLMSPSSVTSAFAKPLHSLSKYFLLGNYTAAKRSRQNIEKVNVPYLNELTASPRLVEAA